MEILPKISIKDFDVSFGVLEDRPISPAPAPAAPGMGSQTPGPIISPRQFLLSELSQKELESLCNAFTNAVFKRAGKRRPVYDTCAKEAGDHVLIKR